MNRENRHKKKSVLLVGMVALLLLGWLVSLHAATYYLSPTGNNANAGTSDAPWLTFAYATASTRLVAGDTLLLKNGTYTTANSGLPAINCASGANNGTSAQPITIKAENERQALLTTTSGADAFFMANCSYWFIEGLRIKGSDQNVSCTNSCDVLRIHASSFITVKRNILSHNNRYKNSGLLIATQSNNLLIEENEFYENHRGSLILSGSNNSTVRRNYANSRGYADIGGGYPSIVSTKGDEAFLAYPGSNNIIENNISEGHGTGFGTQAAGASSNNRWLGNISYLDDYGQSSKAREGCGAGGCVTTDDHTTNFVAINSGVVGYYGRGLTNGRCDNCTFFDSTNHGIIADVEAGREVPNPTFYGDNIFSYSGPGTGLKVTQQNDWLIDYPNSFQNGTNFDPPATDAHITNELSEDPKIGACRVWIPSTATGLKGRGKNGADIGANILYRYQDGVLTTTPLWDRLTGRFPCGATVAGVNDSLGNSCINVHERLNVNQEGCPFPFGYAIVRRRKLK